MRNTASLIQRLLIPIMVLTVIGSLFVALPIFAQAPSDELGLNFVENSGLGRQDIRDTIALIINILLGFLGTLAVLLVLYGGYLVLTSKGNPDQVTKGRQVLVNATVGLIIILSAWGLAAFVLSRLGNATDFQGGGGSRPPSGGSLGTSDGADAIESHYPARNAIEIPRNTKIIITFRDTVDPTTLVDDQGTPDSSDDMAIASAIRIRKSEDDPRNGPFVEEVRASFTDDRKTYVFDPVPLLGNNQTPTNYTVTIGEGVANLQGDLIFGNIGLYSWSFEVSTVIDITPPKIINVIPQVADPPVTMPRNVIVQITFDEAIDPTAASGTVLVSDDALSLTRFNNITISHTENDGSHYFPGTFNISNQYRTVEFVTDDQCGTNACGEDIFCLPGEKALDVLVKAASLSSDPPQAQGFPYDGVVDVAGNSLDGNRDGIATGPLADPTDNYAWSFNTSDEIDLTPPEILYTPKYELNGLQPGRYAIEVPLISIVSAIFSKPLMFKTLTKENVVLSDGLYWVEAEPIGASQSKVIIKHEIFTDDFVYEAQMHSGIKDIFQNCYYNKDRLDIFNGCVGPTVTNQSEDRLHDQQKRTDLILIGQALAEYKDSQGAGRFTISGTGIDGKGVGRVTFSSVNGGGYQNSILDYLIANTSLNLDNLNFTGDSADYELHLCSQGRLFSLSTSLAHPPEAETDASGNEIGSLFDFACQTNPNTGHNYAITNFNTTTILGLYQNRDLMRKDDLNYIKGSLEQLQSQGTDYPGTINSCTYVRETVAPVIGDAGADPYYADQALDYLYYRFADTYALLAVLENVEDGDYSSVELNDCPGSPIYSYCIGACDLIP